MELQDRNALVEGNLGVADKTAAIICRLIPRGRAFFDEARAESLFLLIEAAEKFDPGREWRPSERTGRRAGPVDFAVWAKRYILWKIWDSTTLPLRRRGLREASHLSIEELCEERTNSHLGTKPSHRHRVLAEPPHQYERAVFLQEAERVDNAIGALDPRSRAVIVRRYGCGLSGKETAASLSIGRSTVTAIARRGLDELRDDLLDLRAAA